MNKDYGKLSRYHYGVTEQKHRGVVVTTSVGSRADDFIANIDDRYTYQIGRIPLPHKNRPDLISNTFYDSPRNWWLLMQFNGVTDPFEKFQSGEKIKLPDLS